MRHIFKSCFLFLFYLRKNWNLACYTAILEMNWTNCELVTNIKLCFERIEVHITCNTFSFCRLCNLSFLLLLWMTHSTFIWKKFTFFNMEIWICISSFNCMLKILIFFSLLLYFLYYLISKQNLRAVFSYLEFSCPLFKISIWNSWISSL